MCRLFKKIYTRRKFKPEKNLLKASNVSHTWEIFHTCTCHIPGPIHLVKGSKKFGFQPTINKNG